MYQALDLAQLLGKRLGKDKFRTFLASQDGELIFDQYKNRKMKMGLQTINSCTKSVVSALIGILIDRGMLEGVHIPLSEFFPEGLRRQEDTRKNGITIEHLLTMTAGWDWPEFSEWHYFAPMVFSKDIIQFILDRPLQHNPGEKMNYNSGCSHLLSAIVQKVSGMSAHQFAQEVLLGPLGITETLWHEKQGVSLGADGLRLTAGDMLKFGELFLNAGRWGSHQILSDQWVHKSTRAHYLTYEDIGHYGYHWWASSQELAMAGVSFYFALGFGGQYIIVVPALKLVMVITSGVYHDSLLPLRCFREALSRTFG